MLILASKSAARNALLAGTGLRFEASPAQIDERAVEAEVLGKGGGAIDVARTLAEAKGLTVSRNRPGATVIGADQVLAVGSFRAERAADEGKGPHREGTSDAGGGGDPKNRRFPPPPPPPPAVPLPRSTGEDHRDIMHKPVDMAEASRQLDRLRGRTHYLHSGIALVRDGVVLWSGVETAALTVRAFSPAERDEVLALEGEAVLGSVGGYRLEGPSIRLFEKIEGDYFTILGLPLLPLLAAMRLHAPHLFGQ